MAKLRKVTMLRAAVGLLILRLLLLAFVEEHVEAVFPRSDDLGAAVAVNVHPVEIVVLGVEGSMSHVWFSSSARTIFSPASIEPAIGFSPSRIRNRPPAS